MKWVSGVLFLQDCTALHAQEAMLNSPLSCFLSIDNLPGIVNPNQTKEKMKMKDRVYDEEGGWWDGSLYYDAYGGWYEENGEYNDGCEEKVKQYTKIQKKAMRKKCKKSKTMKKWKSLSWFDRYNLLWDEYGLSKIAEEKKTTEEEEEKKMSSGSKITVVKGSFGIVYNKKVQKSERELEKERLVAANKIHWSWTAEEEKEIADKKTKNYKKMNRRK